MKRKIRRSQAKMIERFRAEGFAFVPCPCPGVLAWIPQGTVVRKVWQKRFTGYSSDVYDVQMEGVYEWDAARASEDADLIAAASRWETLREEEAFDVDAWLARRRLRR